MKYFITYQQFGGGAQIIKNKVIDKHPWDWVQEKNDGIANLGNPGRVVILFFSEMKEEPQLTEEPVGWFVEDDSKQTRLKRIGL